MTTNGHAYHPTTVGEMPDQAYRDELIRRETARKMDREIERRDLPPPPPPPSQQQPIDDKDGHFIVREGDYISDPRDGEGRCEYDVKRLSHPST